MIRVIQYQSWLRKGVLITFLFLIVMPLLLTLLLSFSSFNSFDPASQEFGLSLDWYRIALENTRFREALWNSVSMASIVALITTVIAFILSLSWWNLSQRIVVVGLIILWGIIPAEAQAISFSTLNSSFGLYAFSSMLHGFSICLGILPYAILVLWGVLNTLDINMFAAAHDLGANKTAIIRRIIIPLAMPGIISAFLLSFLLTFNEYIRTFYLSGALQYLPEYLNGKLMSGADASVYAAGGLNVALAIIFLIIGFLATKYFRV